MEKKNQKTKKTEKHSEKPVKIKKAGRFSVGKIFNFGGKEKPYILKIIIIAVILLVVLCGIFYILKMAGYVNFPVTDRQVLQHLKRIILLPDNVTPTMAIVMNADALKQQQAKFFANVKNGDHLIIYPELVIIYDYNANKIIQVGPVQTAKTQ